MFKLYIILLLFFSGFCFAQSDSVKYTLSDIEVSAFKTETYISTSPASVEILLQKQINNINGERLSDILQTAGGLFLKSYGGAASLKSLSLNGLGPEHVLVLLNGARMNSVQNSQFDISLIPKEIIQRVEIIHTGYSSIYGSDAIGGIINIVTKSPVDMTKNLNLNLNAGIGSYGLKKYSLGAGKNFKNLSATVTYSKEESENNYDYYFRTLTDKILKTRENSSYTFENAGIGIDFRSKNKFYLKLFSSLSDSRRNLPGVEAGSDPSNSIQNDKNWNNILSITYSASSHIILKGEANFQNNLMKYADETLINSFYKNISSSVNAQITYVKSDVEITSGVNIQKSFLSSNETYSGAERTQTGVYLVSQINTLKNKRLVLYPSVRFDNYSDLNMQVVSAKFGFNYKLFEKPDLHLRGSAGNSYRAPTFNDFYWKNSGNINLIPEKAFSLDAGVTYGVNWFESTKFDISYSRINMKDKIVWIPGRNGYWSPVNLSRTASDVFSAGMKISYGDLKTLNINLNLNYTYNYSRKTAPDFENDASTGKQIFYLPKDNFKVKLEMNYKSVSANLFYYLTGKRYTDSENILFLPADDVIDGNVIINFKAFATSFQTKFEVNNLLNTDYQMISGYPMPLRNFKMSLTINY